MRFGALIALASAIWLLSCAASVLAVYWNIVAPARRLLAAFISSCLAILIGYWGLRWIQFNASRTVNGHVEWSINSRWFFIGALVLGGASLALTFWNWRKASRRLATGSQGAEGCERFGDKLGAALNGGPAAAPADSGADGRPPSVA
jgi:hypothetical protein